MKTIEELGISPWPWFMNDYTGVSDSDAKTSSVQYGQHYYANARLIAAAPELYEALAALLHCAEREAPYTDMSRMATAIDMARKALAKAGGEEVKHG